MKKVYLLLFAFLSGCAIQPHQPTALENLYQRHLKNQKEFNAIDHEIAIFKTEYDAYELAKSEFIEKLNHHQLEIYVRFEGCKTKASCKLYGDELVDSIADVDLMGALLNLDDNLEILKERAIGLVQRRDALWSERKSIQAATSVIQQQMQANRIANAADRVRWQNWYRSYQSQQSLNEMNNNLRNINNTLMNMRK